MNITHCWRTKFSFQRNFQKEKKAIGSKWVFRLEKKTNNNIDRYKACLVIKGFSHTKRVDFFETFVLVTKFTSIKTLLAFIAIFNFKIHHMDVKSAFLNGEIVENVYMKQPEVYEVARKTNLVCKFKKSIYGLNRPNTFWTQKSILTSEKSTLNGAHKTKVCMSLEMREIYKNF
jgi:hypothetical protein